jgi:hypothetical protein
MKRKDDEMLVMLLTALTVKNGDALTISDDDINALEAYQDKGLSIELKDDCVELKIVEDKPKIIKPKLEVVK